MFQATGLIAMDTMFDMFGQEWQDKRLFMRMLHKYTKDHMVLVYDNHDSQERALVKRYYWYKASEAPAFKMGSPEYWRDSPNGSDVLPKPGLI